jgi:RNA polymerase sigma factor (sigma-70 family)
MYLKDCCNGLITGLMTDIEKWNLFRKGSDDALSIIYSENARALYQYGLKLTRDQIIIEDCIHDMFLDLIRNRKTIGNTDNIRFYLFLSLRRKLLKKIGYEKRYSDTGSDELPFEICYSVEQDLISREQQEKTLNNLKIALERLTPRQKEVIYLRYTKKLDYPEISRIMDMGIEATRNLVCRAIRSLKEMMN